MAGFVIGTVAFALPFVFALTGLGRTRVVIGVGGVLAVGWVLSLAARRTSETAVPLWFIAGLVALLYAIWCGGLWLGLRVRRLRRATPG
jgi:hypothetical protein